MTQNIPISDGFRLRQLSSADENGVQKLCEKCTDYFLLHDGTPPDKNAAADIMNALPPGKSAEDKFVFGVESAEGKLCGVIDLVRDFPSAGTWMLGLMLLDPSARGKGTGKAAHKAFVRWAEKSGAKILRIGVIAENTRGLHFWSSLGYRTEKEISLTCGAKTHRASVMTLSVLSGH